MMIANDPAVATAIRATAFTPMPLTGRSVLRVLPESEGDKPRPAGMEAPGTEPSGPDRHGDGICYLAYPATEEAIRGVRAFVSSRTTWDTHDKGEVPHQA